MIDAAKKYKTRAGNDVRLLMTNGGGEYPVIGAINRSEDWAACSWTDHGRCFSDSQESCDDLVEVKPERTLWLNVYEASAAYVVYTYTTNELADRGACRDSRIACVKVTFREGDGLA